MNNTRMQEVTMEVSVGFFVLMIMCLIMVFSIFISKSNLFTESYPVSVRFEHVAGLRPGDKVYYRGMEFGQVGEMTMRKDSKAVDIIIEMDQEITLHEDYRFEIQTASALGGKQMVIDEGTLDNPLLTDFNDLRGEKPADLLEEATELISYVKRELEENGLLDNLATSAESLKAITAKIDQGEGTISKLINEDGLYKEAEEITKNLREISERLNQGEGTLAKLLSDDDTLYNDMSEIAKNLKASSAKVDGIVDKVAKITDRVESGEGTLGKLLSEDDQLYQNLVEASESIKEVTATLNKADGTIGRLMNDDELYQDVLSLVDEARATLDDLRETSPITTFASIFFGAF